MTDEERIIKDLISGDYHTTVHAEIRMGERNITDSDISNCAKTAASVTRQENGKFRVQGLDLDGDLLSVVCIWDGDTLVITLF